jgi:hypothetical protein
MKYISYLLLAMFSTMLLSACDDEAPTEYREQIAVDGFMWIGQRLEVRLTHSVEFGVAYYEDSVKVTGAEVLVTVDGLTHALTEAVSGVTGTYAAPDSVHVVTTGKRYDLMIVKNGDTLRAHTTAVAPLTITQATLMSGEEVADPNPDTLEYGGNELRLRWTTSPVNFGYAVMVESLEEDKYGEACDYGDDNGPGNYLFIWSTRYIEQMDLPWITLCYTGPTRIRIFSCDTMWWNYVSTILVGELSNDPVSNIEGGKGVFCAVGCDTFEIAVTDTLED